ncbi:hypothetical protein QCB45_05215 [Thiomicrorhabdus sp. ZW0627]|uniref:hypothetical protein n=1 Tax=Thiomicrorhabdus sp. ZW0627 TaxID=3039774 RepID=UPI0024373A5E|nr:hypothetical protein [Thiomicrorhabdus sp. ZW0627]MDG6773723.1 hypothetical protein [Thiomicrorhabdus sp. ZW0627]
MKQLKDLFTIFGNFLYLLAILMLFGIALILMLHSIWEIISDFWSKESMIKNMLQAIGATIVAIAIIDVAKYLAEEELFRDRELRSPAEARKTLTKIVTILIIAIGLEGLVYIFKAGLTDLRLLLYPALLFTTSILALVALGVYQKLSINSEIKADKTEQAC